MDLPPALRGPWNPLRITGTPMPPVLLLQCKVLAVAFLATEHFRILPDPFLPFVDFLEHLAPPDTFRTVLRWVAVGSACTLLLNRSVRASALLLGSCFLVAVLSSRAYYGNNKTFVGLCLVLTGLSDFDRPPYFLRWQLSLTYFGAALNKLLDADWQSGVFFDFWGGEKVRNPVFLYVRDVLPPLWAGWVMCWFVIVAEFFVAFALFLPRLLPWALWANILFQVGLLQFTGGTFTLFFYAMTAATLAFVVWPTALRVRSWPAGPGWTWLRAWCMLGDPDGLQTWNQATVGRAEVEEGGRLFHGFFAVRRLFLFSPVLWLGVCLVLARLTTPLGRRLFVAVVLAFFLPTIRLCRRAGNESNG